VIHGPLRGPQPSRSSPNEQPRSPLAQYGTDPTLLEPRLTSMMPKPSATVLRGHDHHRGAISDDFGVAGDRR
jgi:hypothetical protein